MVHRRIQVDARETEVAELLLGEGAVLIRPSEPFTFVSGVVSPIYCDLRLLTRSPGRRKRIAELLAAEIEEIKTRDVVDVVAGVATAGISWAAWASEEAGLPMAYVRESAKEHGRGQQVEGGAVRGQTAVVIEDLTSTGASAVTAIEGLRAIGVRASYCLSICTYESPRATNNFRQAWVSYSALCGISRVLQVARDTERMSTEEEGAAREWLLHGPMSR